jgi:2-dehydro-3-deoxyphosphogluconate aldolase / (4S)-4-hydroxy-2-oxoglutarate aldolase
MSDAPSLSPPSPTAFAAELENTLCEDSLLAVLTVRNVEDAVPLARSLVEGGVKIMELAWRTPGTLAALEAIRREVPEMIAGVGTLLTVEQLRVAQEAGAAFGVSPGLSVTLLKAAAEIGFSYAPGVMTPSDVQIAVENGSRFLKFFPAESAGGLVHLRSMNAPFAHLGLRYIVLGGLNEENAVRYLEESCVSVLGGSWIAPPDLISRKDWASIRERAKRARASLKGCSTET